METERTHWGNGELVYNFGPKSLSWAPRPIAPVLFPEDRPAPAPPVIAPPLLGSRRGTVLAHREATGRWRDISDNADYPLISFNW